LNLLLILISSVSFLGYGSACFFSPYLKCEFERYGFASKRTLVGTLQLLASLGLILGFWKPVLGSAASFGLTLMMLLAILVRIRIKDSFLQTLPALFYLLLNLYLLLQGFR